MRSFTPHRLRGRRPSPAMVVSIIALIVALGGTATAATIIRSSSQVRAGAITGSDLKDATVANRDLRNNAVTAEKVRNGSIQIDDLESAARSALGGGSSGAEALEAFRKDGPQNQEPGKVVRIATLNNIPAGTYAIFAKTVLTPQDPAEGSLFGQGKTVAGHCVLDVGGDRDEMRVLLSTPGSLAPGGLNLQITRSFGSPGTATLDCDTSEARFNATDTSIIAVRVGRAPRTAVEG